MKKTYILRLLSLVILFAMALTFFASCKNGGESTKPVTEETSAASNSFDISDFRIIRAYSAPTSMKDYMTEFRKVLNEKTGAGVKPVSLDLDIDPSDREIIIGSTKREESAALLEEIKKTYSKNAYAIKAEGKKIIINGFTDDDLILAMKYFISEILSKAEDGKKSVPLKEGETIVRKSGEIIYKDAGFGKMIVVEERSTVFTPPNKKLNEACSYGKIIKLEHQSDPKNNGILISTKEANAYDSKSSDVRYPIMRSHDDGATWEEVLRLDDIVNKKASTIGYQPYFFELPEDVGEYKKGTILFACCSWVVTSTKIGLPLMASTDCGTTWEPVGNIAIGGRTEGQTWNSQGVWEPVLQYENGKLYCFYSDELENGKGANHEGGHNQRLVYKYTTDLKTWSDTKECVASETPNDRPGMVALAKMGNGKWALAFEYTGSALQIKFADTLESWDPADLGVKVKDTEGHALGSGPAMGWTPHGGECGTLFLTASWGEESTTKCDMLLSFDYGQTFISIPNPINLAYTGNVSLYGGYSSGMYVDSEGALYYVNNPQNKENLTQETLEFVKIKVYN